MIEDQTRENSGNRALSRPYFLILDNWASQLRRLFLYTSFSCASWSACSSCSFFDSISSSSCLFFSSAWEKNLQEIIRQSTRGEGEWISIFRPKVEEKVKGVKIVWVSYTTLAYPYQLMFRWSLLFSKEINVSNKILHCATRTTITRKESHTLALSWRSEAWYASSCSLFTNSLASLSS